MPVSRPKSTPNDVRQLVLERDEHACYRCGTSGDLVTNHRYGGMGGRREQAPADLCTLCALCNGWCEDNLRAAYVAGWRIRRGALSGHQVPLRDSLNREWRLHVDGTRTRQHAPLPEAAA